MTAAVRLTFHGAAKTVTGSRFLLETEKSQVLVDCGLFQGKKVDRLKNWDAPSFKPEHLSAVVLTHAHIDHSGYLPKLVSEGFRGPIFCTAATKALLNLLLPDSAHLQEEEARHANKHKTSKHHPAKPLYSMRDAEEALSMLQAFDKHTLTPITPDVSVTAYCAGHILGSAILCFDTCGKRITFSGDIGRYNTPLLPDPEPVTLGDMLICESTYGDRYHADTEVTAELARVINEAAGRSGPLLIPSFAVGRTQNLLFWIRELEEQGRIPKLPVIVDSPMAIDATEIYRDFHHDFDNEAKAMLKVGKAPLKTALTAFSRSTDDSKKLNTLSGPRIIISASGMATGGRILHHLAHWLDNESATVLFVGFQGAGTRGRLIESGAREVKIFGRYIPVHAHVRSISGLSAHGDRGELLRWLQSCKGTPRITRIVHGEPEASRAFSDLLNHELSWNAQPAEFLETVEL